MNQSETNDYAVGLTTRQAEQEIKFQELAFELAGLKAQMSELLRLINMGRSNQNGQIKEESSKEN